MLSPPSLCAAEATCGITVKMGILEAALKKDATIIFILFFIRSWLYLQIAQNSKTELAIFLFRIKPKYF